MTFFQVPTGVYPALEHQVMMVSLGPAPVPSSCAQHLIRTTSLLDQCVYYCGSFLTDVLMLPWGELMDWTGQACYY